MFKWLTRNDGKRVERAKRRIASPRASVFTEFALVVPIVALVCSAMIEIVGYWDAQVMANHAAWTVGRIAMVRGSDGMEFSNDLSKKSKTGRYSNLAEESATLTFIRKGALKNFLLTGKETTSLSFIDAVKYLECKPDERRINVGSSYYSHYDANNTAFDESLAQDKIITHCALRISN